MFQTILIKNDGISNNTLYDLIGFWSQYSKSLLRGCSTFVLNSNFILFQKKLM